MSPSGLVADTPISDGPSAGDSLLLPGIVLMRPPRREAPITQALRPAWEVWGCQSLGPPELRAGTCSGHLPGSEGCWLSLAPLGLEMKIPVSASGSVGVSSCSPFL